MKDSDLMSDGQINREWKDFWRSKEGNPALKRELRREKRRMKRDLHKKSRRKAKDLLRDYLDQ